MPSSHTLTMYQVAAPGVKGWGGGVLGTDMKFHPSGSDYGLGAVKVAELRGRNGGYIIHFPHPGLQKNVQYRAKA